MFILTSSGRLINSDHLKEICHTETVIFAHTENKDEAVLLNCYDTEQECELAFDELIETLKVHDELLDMDVSK